jgi:hypothetical protein
VHVSIWHDVTCISGASRDRTIQLAYWFGRYTRRSQDLNLWREASWMIDHVHYWIWIFSSQLRTSRLHPIVMLRLGGCTRRNGIAHARTGTRTTTTAYAGWLYISTRRAAVEKNTFSMFYILDTLLVKIKDGRSR